MSRRPINTNPAKNSIKYSKTISEVYRRDLDNIIPSIRGIPKHIISELKVADYDPALGLVQVTYLKDSIPSADASHERGKIYDIKTGIAVCGGSTYTSLAVAENDSINISKYGNIHISEIDNKGNKITNPRNTDTIIFPGMEEVYTAADPFGRFEAQAREGNFIENLTNDSNLIRGMGTFIRPYMEGTHLSVYCARDGKVRIATHSKINARGKFDSSTGVGKITGMSKYAGVNFSRVYDEIAGKGGPLDKKLFPVKGCLCSPYVYRFLLCAPELTNASRVVIINKYKEEVEHMMRTTGSVNPALLQKPQVNAFLVFIGVQKMWDFDSDTTWCPYQFGASPNPSDPRPYGGLPDDRSLQQVIDIKSMVSIPVIDTITGMIDEPCIYYPKHSFSKQECDDFLSRGFDIYSEEPNDLTNVDQRLYPGESLMMTAYYTFSGKRYVKNIRVFSQSCFYRYECHEGSSSMRNNMLKFTIKSQTPGAFPNDIPIVVPLVFQSVYDVWLSWINKGGLVDFPIPQNLENVAVKDLAPAIRRLISLNVYIYTCNPSRYAELIDLLVTFLAKCHQLAEWLVYNTGDEDVTTGTIADSLIEKATTLTRTFADNINMQMIEQGEQLTDEVMFANLQSAAQMVIHNSLNYVECDTLIRFIDMDWSAENAADKFRYIKMKPETLAETKVVSPNNQKGKGKGKGKGKPSSGK